LATLLQLFAKSNFAEQADGSSDGTDKPLTDDTTLELTVVADDSEETAADDNSVTLADDNVNGEIIGVLIEALSESGQLDFDNIVKCKIKDAMPVWFDHNCLHLSFKLYLGSESYFCKLPNKMSLYVKILQKNSWLCLFMFRPITFQQLNNMTSIVTFRYLGGRDVTLLTAVRVVPGSIPGFGNDFYVCLSCFVNAVILFMCKDIFTLF